MPRSGEARPNRWQAAQPPKRAGARAVTLPGDPLVWIAAWVLVAAALSALPSRRRHWPLAVLLIAAGLPILAASIAAGWFRGAMALLVAALVLRWPLRHAARRIARMLGA